MPRDIVITEKDRAEALAFLWKHFGPRPTSTDTEALAGLLAAVRDAGYVQGWDAAFREAL